MQCPHVFVRFAAAAVATAAVVASSLSVMAMTAAPASFYDLETKALDGKPGNLAQYKGKVAVVVNVASKCGYTPQYAGLEKLHRELTPKGVVVLGFPSNDFGGQEPGTAEEIATFCKTKYDVSFPLFEKGVTKAGPTQSPIYQVPRRRPGTSPAGTSRSTSSTRRARSSRSSRARSRRMRRS